MRHTAIITFLPFLLTVLASCCKTEIINFPETGPDRIGATASSKSPEESDYAHIRLGVYASIDNYSITVTGIRTESARDAGHLPQPGNQITECGRVSDSLEDPTFDMEGGQYHDVLPCLNGTEIKVIFDVLLSCNDGLSSIEVKNASITIPADKTIWKAGFTYSYIIRLDEGSLGLHPISFNASVTDYTNCIIIQ